MTSFDDRKDTFEKKFAHDEALKFKIESRRNKLLGQWAAEIIGLSDDEVKEYTKKLIRADFQEPGDDDVFQALKADFTARGITQSDENIRKTMDELLQQAVDEINTGT